MSTTISKIAIGAAVCYTIGSIYFVLDFTAKEKARLHQGVIKDEERLAKRKEKIVELEIERQKTEELRHQQAQQFLEQTHKTTK